MNNMNNMNNINNMNNNMNTNNSNNNNNNNNSNNMNNDMKEVNEKVDIIVNQTNYTRDEAERELEHHKNDEVLVIRHYLRGSTVGKDKSKDDKTSKQVASKNQLVYSEIRKFMDACGVQELQPQQ